MDQWGGLIAETIKDSMKKRESKLLDNDVLLAGIFVDPKSRVLLTSSEKVRAKATLLQIAVRMRKLEKSLLVEVDDASDEEVPEEIVDNDPMQLEQEDFDAHLDEMSIRSRREEPEDVQNETEDERFIREFNKALLAVEKIDRTSKIGVHVAITKYPEIVKDVARLVTSLPTTQVSGPIHQIYHILFLWGGTHFIASK